METEAHIGNRLAFITGAAQRIGKAMAERLAAQGWNIAIHYNTSASPAAELAERLKQQFPGQQFEIFRADLNSRNETIKLIPEVIAAMGIPELLINNASVFEAAPIKETTAGAIDLHFNVNFTAPFILIRDFALLCGNGQIINLTDTRITKNKSNYAAYSLSKKALWELTKMAAVELGPQIRVNAISPGLTLPPGEKDESYLWNLAQKIPLKRPGGIQPVLKAVDFLLDNDYLTGQMIFCDGGENLS